MSAPVWKGSLHRWTSIRNLFRWTWYRGRLTWKRGLLYLATAVVSWLLLSLLLFIISAEIERGKVPDSAKAALTSGPNMLTSTNTVLILGTDQRPKGSKEPGANTSDAGSRSDTIMLWRIGGGTSRRLSIPRDTVVPIPGHGDDKINAADAYGVIGCVSALTNSSSWSVRQHSNAVQYCSYAAITESP